MEAFATKALERYWTINAGVLEVPILLARCLSVQPCSHWYLGDLGTL